VATLASAGKLPEALITEAGLSINPIRQNESDVDDIARRLYGMLPRLRITELLAEVHSWTGFAEQFVHLRTGEPPEDPIALMTAVLADATNLGLARMAWSSGVFSHTQLLWAAVASWRHCGDRAPLRREQAALRLGFWTSPKGRPAHRYDGRSESDGQMMATIENMTVEAQ
jgi:hypothetical protein